MKHKPNKRTDTATTKTSLFTGKIGIGLSAIFLIGMATCTPNERSVEILDATDLGADEIEPDIAVGDTNLQDSNDGFIEIIEDTRDAIMDDGAGGQKLICKCSCVDGKIATGTVEVADDVMGAADGCQMECIAGCSYDYLPQCDDSAMLSIAAWITDEADEVDPVAPMNVVVSGVVEEVGTGLLDTAIPMMTSGRTLGRFLSEESLQWFRIKDPSDAIWAVQYALDGVEPFEIGEQVSVDFVFGESGWGTTEGSIHILRGNSQGFWIGQGDNVSDLYPPGGFVLGGTSLQCRDSDVCGSWVVRNLGIGRLDGGPTAEIPAYESTKITGATVGNGGIVVEASMEDGCFDWTKNSALIGIAWNTTADE